MEMFSGESWALIALGGFVVGFLVGMTGVGAGALTTPMLISGFGVAPAVAVGTDLLFASITKLSAAWRHHRLGNVHWKILLTLAAGSLLATLATLAWLHYFAPDTSELAFMVRRFLAIALVGSAFSILVIPLLLRSNGALLNKDVKVRPVWTVAFGVLLGVVVTLTSVGAGAIGVAVLSLLYPAMRPRLLVGTDIAHAVPLAFLAGIGHLSMGNVKVDLLVALLVGSVPGILLGSRLIGYVPDWLLRIFLAVVLLVAAYMLLDEATMAHLRAIAASYGIEL